MRRSDVSQAVASEGATPSPSSPFLRRRQAAALLGLSSRTLEDMARRGEGPPYFKPAGRGIVLYSSEELFRWVERGRIATSGSTPQEAD
jgi:hypothetical protein